MEQMIRLILLGRKFIIGCTKAFSTLSKSFKKIGKFADLFYFSEVIRRRASYVPYAQSTLEHTAVTKRFSYHFHLSRKISIILRKTPNIEN
jgi:hypothetical protein